MQELGVIGKYSVQIFRIINYAVEKNLECELNFY